MINNGIFKTKVPKRVIEIQLLYIEITKILATTY